MTSIAVDHGISGLYVTRILEQAARFRVFPQAIRTDGGPEFTSRVFMGWRHTNVIEHLFIQPGKPTQNAYVERFNRTVRQEWLDLYLFESVEHAQELATQWLWTYNNERPHSAIAGVPPRQLIERNLTPTFSCG